jgi:carbonic anhydrase
LRRLNGTRSPHRPGAAELVEELLRVEARELTLHGWHYVIEDGEVHVFDVQRGCFVPAAHAEHSGTGPYKDHPSDAEQLFNEIGGSWPVG